MFESNRLLYRSMEQEDLEDFFEIFSSDNVDRFVKKMTHEDVEKFFEKMKTKLKNPYSFAVVEKKSGKMIGTVALKEKEEKVGTLSYVFNDRFWGKGYASESVEFLITSAHQLWGFDVIKADCQADNEASKRILDKFGFELDFSNFDNISHKTGLPVEFNYYHLNLGDKNGRKC